MPNGIFVGVKPFIRTAVRVRCALSAKHRKRLDSDTDTVAVVRGDHGVVWAWGDEAGIDGLGALVNSVGVEV